MSRKRVTVVDYDPDWPGTFATLSETLGAALGNLAVEIHHIGSTAVPGLAAKPCIDIGVVVETTEEIAPAIDRLAPLGYVHQGDEGIEGRETFDSPSDHPEHHLYVYTQHNLGFRNHLAVRDYLRAHAEAGCAYGNLKKRLARDFATDRDAYMHGKTEFLLGVLAKAGLTPDDRQRIARMNQGIT